MEVTIKDISPGVCEVIDSAGVVIGLMVRSSKYCTYNKLHAEMICDRVAMGESISKICEEKNMPSYTTLMKWAREHEEFAIMYQQAKEERADSYFSKVLEEADLADGVTKEFIASHKLRSDTYKWAAQVSKPREYGNKSVVSGDIGTVTIRVETGIRRPGDEVLEAAQEVKELDNGSKQITEHSNVDSTAGRNERGDSGEDLFD
jgi:transposase-like protein